MAVVSSIQHGISMKQILVLLAFGLLVPAAALAQVDAEVAAQCKVTRDFYGWSGPLRLQPVGKLTLALLLDQWGRWLQG